MAKYTKERLEVAVSESSSYADVARWFGSSPVGGTVSHIARQIRKFEIDTEHFLGNRHMRGKIPSNRKQANEIFRVLPEGSLRAKPEQLRRALTEVGVPYECSSCGIDEWMGETLSLHIDHIDGDYKNCVGENLRFLCPNCHSQTFTYCRKKGI